MSSPNPDLPPPPSETIPSSFDDTEFFEEGRMQKLWRKIKQEPLIPIGCAATCYALYQATNSIRAGDHTRTNRMFRARIYAQGFTLVAIVAGSFFYQDERLKRKKFESAVEDKKAVEKRDKWLRELEARDEEERAWRAKIEEAYNKAEDAKQTVQKTSKDVKQAAQNASKDVKQAAQSTSKDVKQAVENQFPSKSIREQVIREGWGPGTWLLRAHDAWKRA